MSAVPDPAAELVSLGRLVHELEAPLLSIEARLRAVTDPESEAGIEAAAGCLAEVQHLRRMLASLVPLARGSFEHTAFALAPVLDRLATRFSPIARERGIALRFDPLPHGMSASGDARATEHIISNLIDNALKFTPEGREVRVRGDSSAERSRVQVIDEGPGLTEDEARQAFEPFYRARPETPGFGLGLTIARRFAERQGGSLEHEASERGGSIFTLVLDA